LSLTVLEGIKSIKILAGAELSKIGLLAKRIKGSLSQHMDE